MNHNVSTHDRGVNNGKGFTLIELILVLVIMGFLMALVTPAITSFTGLKLKIAARKIAAGLRYARSQTVICGSECQVLFNLGNGEMTVECLKEKDFYNAEGGTEQGADRSEERGKAEEVEDTRPRVERKTYTLPKEIKLAKVVVEGEEITEDEAVIDFYPNGSCSGGEIFLMDEREREYRISLDFLTGVVEITVEEEV